MKLIILFISLIAIASSTSSSEEETTKSLVKSLSEEANEIEFATDNESKLKLQEIYNTYYKDRDQSGREYGTAVPDVAERECVKEKMNLSANGEKLVPRTSANYFLKISLAICSNEKDEKLEEQFDQTKDEFSAIDDKATKIFCLRRKIKELNGADKVEIKECKQVNEACEKLIGLLERDISKFQTVGIGECVNLNANRFNSKLFETILLNFEENDEAYKNARKEFIEGMKSLMNKISDCLVIKFNDLQ